MSKSHIVRSNGEHSKPSHPDQDNLSNKNFKKDGKNNTESFVSITRSMEILEGTTDNKRKRK